MRLRRALALSTASAVPLVALAVIAAPGHAATACDTLTAPVYHRINPTSQAALLTLSRTEADNAAARYGFTTDAGTPFKAASQSSSGLVPVHRLHKSSPSDFVWIPEGPELTAAISNGYADQGTNFYALSSSSGCAAPVDRFVKNSKHRFAVSAADRSALTAVGWTAEGTKFYAVAAGITPPPTDTKFSLATMPDTQQEVLRSGDPRFLQRTNWLVSNRSALDLRFVTHTGDVVNWGWLVPSQYTVAGNAMRPLEQAGIPYALSIGNHDTRAVGWNGVAGSREYGGSAYASNPECPERLGAAQCKTPLLVRHTEEFNATFTAARYTDVAGAYQSGKVDNIYSTFDAGGVHWLVLTLELWPRTEVIDWARSVVAAHPNANVIVQTHSYLEANGSISQSNGGYGSNSPQYLYDHLIKVYPNIKMVLSGHVGTAAMRTDTGVNGNKIVSFLQCFHSTSNPVRLTEIDTAQGTLSSRIYAPQDAAYWTQYDASVSGMSFVKP